MKKKNTKEKEQWLDKLKLKLEDYAEPIPSDGWEQLEKMFSSGKETAFSDEKKKIYPYYQWVAVAAVLIFVAASSLSLYFLNTPAANEIRSASHPVLANDPNALSQPFNSPIEVTPKVVLRSSHRKIVAKNNIKIVRENPSFSTSPSVLEQRVNDEGAALADTDHSKEESTTETKEKTPVVKRVHTLSTKDKLHLPGEREENEKGKWSAGALVGNAGSLSENSGREMNGSAPQRVSLSNPGNDFMVIPENQVLLFKNGIPYLQQINEIVKMKHRQPISVGLSIRKELSHGFSIETGVTYTLLSSDLNIAGNNSVLHQKLHYMGIPVRANWTFLNKNRFALYVSAGGQIEKCIFGKLNNEEITVKPFQFSVLGAVGAQFNATKRLGFYVEPGVAYFFNDGSNVQTIRKENPFNLNLQAGVRFTY